VLFIDLDNFKAVNDTHGHLVGSQLLQHVGTVLRDTLREVDCVIRYGGDEFVVLLLGSTADAGLLAAERLRRKVAKETFNLADDAKIQLTCSIGVAAFPDHAASRDELLRLADQSMYRSKKGGKNRVSIVTGQSVGGAETLKDQ